MTERRQTRRLFGVLFCCLLFPLVPFAIVGELPGERWLLATDDNALYFGASGAALLALDVLLPIPSSLVGALLGGRLGFAPGFAWAFIGLCVGHATGYGLGRLMPERWASELPRAPTLWVVFLSRPVPVLAEAIAIAAGAERVALVPYFLTMASGNALYAAALAANGAALLPQGLAGPGLVLPMLLPVFAWLAWRTLARGR